MFFFITFSLSTELLEDKQRFKLGGVDTSPSYLLCQTLLPLFWTLTCMIWMKLTRTDAFSAELPWCCFMCRKEKFLECPENPRRHFLELIKNIGKRINVRGPHPDHEGGGASPASWAPWSSTDLNSNSVYSRSGRKKSERKFHRVLRYGAAAKP